ncbi:MAG: RICIN domain-containing protein [Coprococcus sp.]
MYSPIQGNGYYKIKNVGSGEYLGVTGQKSASGSNVEQASGGIQRWQGDPGWKGSYYIVPECSGNSCNRPDERHRGQRNEYPDLEFII